MSHNHAGSLFISQQELDTNSLFNWKLGKWRKDYLAPFHSRSKIYSLQKKKQNRKEKFFSCLFKLNFIVFKDNWNEILFFTLRQLKIEEIFNFWNDDFFLSRRHLQATFVVLKLINYSIEMREKRLLLLIQENNLTSKEWKCFKKR